jgi:hypothetical protein
MRRHAGRTHPGRWLCIHSDGVRPAHVIYRDEIAMHTLSRTCQCGPRREWDVNVVIIVHDRLTTATLRRNRKH